MLIFEPPWTMFGEKVVCVQAWNCRAMPSGQVLDRRRMKPSGESEAAAISSGRSMPATNRRHDVVDVGAGRRSSAMRRTTSAALTSALSVRKGWEPCPGVPRDA